MENYSSKHKGTTIDAAIDIVTAVYGDINLIGVPGAQGFGVGICPPQLLPADLVPLSGTFDKTNDNYGNYSCTTDGSIMVWVPRFYYKITNVADAPYLGTKVEIKGVDTYPNEGNANADGYALHRAFVDGGAVKSGFFVDKYKWSLTNFVYNSAGVASSIKNGNPISSAVDSERNATNLFAGAFTNCKSNSQAPTNIYGGAWAAAKSRGANYAVSSIFIFKALSLLSLAHGQAATNTTNCAWYLANKIYPKGNNNYGADVDDATCTFTACDDAYWAARNEARKNGSGSTFAKTTHNGQNCGVSDLQGDQYQITQGLTCTSASQNLATGNISLEAQAIITKVAHGYADGDVLFVEGANTGAGWNTAMQYRFFTVSDKTDDTFKLKKRTNDAGDGNYLDASALGAYDTANGTFTCTKGVFYILKESATLKDVTGGSGAATDHFANTTLFDTIDLSAILINTYASDRFGSGTNQVLGMNITRTHNDYKLTSVGLPNAKTAISSGGTNNFGTDYLIKWILSNMCPLVGGYWE